MLLLASEITPVVRVYSAPQMTSEDRLKVHYEVLSKKRKIFVWFFYA